MPELPTGTLTFLFTDIEGSTPLLRQLGEGYDAVVDDHGRIMREAITAEGGVGVRTEGDAVFAVFPTATGALRAATAAQRALAAHPWPDGETVWVRMGLHTGEGRLGGDDYVGLDVHVAARVASAAHGGQTLLSAATRSLVEASLPEGTTLRDLGAHRLKGIEQPVGLSQLDVQGLPTDFPPVRTLDTRPTNLPVPRTSFVGREREVAEVLGLLDSTRLLTLTGPGGTGKTRLALEAGTGLLERFGDGVFFVDLSLVAEPELVPAAVAAALAVREESGRDMVDTLGEYLRDRELLIILDNVEQVADAAPVVGRLLDTASGLRVMATSRVPLHISGEAEYPVQPLGLPDPKRPPEADGLGQYAAVALFIDRATEVRPDFRVTNDNAPAVAEIAARLDGLPLAIELAASRAKVLDPGAMLARLAQRLPLLAGGPRDRPLRQQTLRAAIDWSHDLLDESEQRLFARMSVFAGGCTLEAAEAVCALGLDHDVLDGLFSLVDKSLVTSGDAVGAGTRFSMLETLREYAAERLEASGEADDIRRRHLELFRELAEESEPHLTADDQGEWFGRLEREHDNLRAALARAVEVGEVETGLRVGAALWRFWQQRGHLAEGRMWLDRIFSLPGAQRRDPVRVRALGALGGVAYWQNDYEPMGRAYREAVDIAREVGDPRLLARALVDLSYVPFVAGELDGAEALLHEGLEAARAAGDAALVAEASSSFGFLHFFRGDTQAAVAPIEESVAIYRELGNRFLLADALMGFGGVLIAVGDVDAADARFREALELAAEADNVIVVQGALHALAMAAMHRGTPDRAARLMGATARLRDEAGGGAPPELIGRFVGDVAAEAREALGDERFEAATAEGHALSRDEAVAYALEDRE